LNNRYPLNHEGGLGATVVTRPPMLTVSWASLISIVTLRLRGSTPFMTGS